jgi:hypothetical protein
VSSGPTDPELVRLIEGSASLDELRAALSARGFELSIRKLRKRLKDAWSSRPVDVVDEPEPGPLPASFVRRGGIEYHVHGIVHGQRRVARVGGDVRAAVRSAIAAWDDPPSSGVCLERGVAGVFGVSDGYELRYTERLVRSAGGRLLVRTLLRALLLLPVLPFASLLMRLSRDRTTRELPHAMRSLPAFFTFRRRYLATELPPRIALDLDRGHASGRLRVLHSEAQAEAAVQRAEELGVRVMHVIVGLAHEADVAHMLASIPD